MNSYSITGYNGDHTKKLCFFNTVITGPGHVWLQTMPISNVAGALRPYLPNAGD